MRCVWRGYHVRTGSATGTTSVVWSTACADCGTPLTEWPSPDKVQIEAIVAFPDVTLEPSEYDDHICWCCGGDSRRLAQPDPWDGRLDGYCDSCAMRRCDAAGAHVGALDNDEQVERPNG